MSPSRCTQNPAMGEEWRRGWHPEIIRAKESESKVLIVGAGPTGLEAARALGQRGYEVALAEASTELGGRVARESKLPGLSAWGRVKDYRAYQIGKMPNVEIYYDSRLDADQVLEFGFDHVLVATGAAWRHDGVAHHVTLPLAVPAQAEVLSPDDLMAGQRPRGKNVVLYDDDHYYMGGVLAELLVQEGCTVTLVTPATEVSNWARNTMEQFKIQARLLELGVGIVTGRALSAIHADGVETACVFTGRIQRHAADSLVSVTARLPDDRLYLDLKARSADWADAGVKSVKCAGDAWGPSTIAAAVYAGRRFAEELDAPDIGDALPFRREITELLKD